MGIFDYLNSYDSIRSSQRWLKNKRDLVEDNLTVNNIDSYLKMIEDFRTHETTDAKGEKIVGVANLIACYRQGFFDSLESSEALNDRAKAYLREPQPYENFSHQPKKIVQLKKIINALYQVEKAFRILEEKETYHDLNTLLHLKKLYSEGIKEAYAACELITSLDDDILTTYASELSFLQESISQFKILAKPGEGTPFLTNLAQKATPSYIKMNPKALGNVIGEAVEQLAPGQGLRIDTTTLIEVAASLPQKIERLSLNLQGAGFYLMPLNTNQEALIAKFEEMKATHPKKTLIICQDNQYYHLKEDGAELHLLASFDPNKAHGYKNCYLLINSNEFIKGNTDSFQLYYFDAEGLKQEVTIEDKQNFQDALQKLIEDQNPPSIALSAKEVESLIHLNGGHRRIEKLTQANPGDLKTLEHAFQDLAAKRKNYKDANETEIEAINRLIHPKLSDNDLKALQSQLAKLQESSPPREDASFFTQISWLAQKTYQASGLIGEINGLTADILEAFANIHETSEEELCQKLHSLKQGPILELLTFADKLEQDFLLKPGTLSQPLMEQLKSIYDAFYAYSQKTGLFNDEEIEKTIHSPRHQDLFSLNEPKYVEKRLQKTGERMHKAQIAIQKEVKDYEATHALPFYNLTEEELKSLDAFLKLLDLHGASAITTIAEKDKAKLRQTCKTLEPFFNHLHEKGILGKDFGLNLNNALSHESPNALLYYVGTVVHYGSGGLIQANQSLTQVAQLSPEFKNSLKALIPANQKISTLRETIQAGKDSIEALYLHTDFYLTPKDESSLSFAGEKDLNLEEKVSLKAGEKSFSLSATEAYDLCRYYAERRLKLEMGKAALAEFLILLSPGEAKNLTAEDLQRLRSLYVQFQGFYLQALEESGMDKAQLETLDQRIVQALNPKGCELYITSTLDSNQNYKNCYVLVKAGEKIEFYYHDTQGAKHEVSIGMDKIPEFQNALQGLGIDHKVKERHLSDKDVETLIAACETKPQPLYPNTGFLNHNEMLAVNQWFKDKTEHCGKKEKGYLLLGNKKYSQEQVEHSPKKTDEKRLHHVIEKPIYSQYLASMRTELEAYIPLLSPELQNELAKREKRSYELKLLNKGERLEELEDKVLYLEMTNQQGLIRYRVKDHLGREQSNYIHCKDIEGFKPWYPLTQGQLESVKEDILKITTHYGHTHEGVPFPNLEYADKLLAEPQTAILSIKQLFNALYHLEKILEELEGLEHSTSQASQHKLFTVLGFIKIYGHFYQINNTIYALQQDPHLFLLAETLKGKADALNKKLEAKQKLYIPKMTAALNIAEPGVKEEQANVWETLQALRLPELNHASEEEKAKILAENKNKLALIEKLQTSFDNSAWVSLIFKTPAMTRLLLNLLQEADKLTQTINQGTKAEILNLEKEFITPIFEMLDILEHQLGLKPGSLSNEMRDILDEFYLGLIESLSLSPSDFNQALKGLEEGLEARLEKNQEKQRNAIIKQENLQESLKLFNALEKSISILNGLPKPEKVKGLLNIVDKAAEIDQEFTPEEYKTFYQEKKEEFIEAFKKCPLDTLILDERLPENLKQRLKAIYPASEEAADLRNIALKMDLHALLSLTQSLSAYLQGQEATQGLEARLAETKATELQGVLAKRKEANQAILAPYEEQLKLSFDAIFEGFMETAKAELNKELSIQAMQFDIQIAFLTKLEEAEAQIIQESRKVIVSETKAKELLEAELKAFKERELSYYKSLDRLLRIIDNEFEVYLSFHEHALDNKEISLFENKETIESKRIQIEKLKALAKDKNQTAEQRYAGLCGIIDGDEFKTTLAAHCAPKGIVNISLSWLEYCIDLLRVALNLTPKTTMQFEKTQIAQAIEALKQKEEKHYFPRFNFFGAAHANHAAEVNKEEEKQAEPEPIPQQVKH